MDGSGANTGIGSALRAAREHRGKSLEEASRETRVRADYLRALEQEWFEVLGSDVYVRGFLRSYAKYLGLNHDKVVAQYERSYGKRTPAPAPVERAVTVTPTEALVLIERKPPNWLLAGLAAVIVIAAAWAIGLIGFTDAVPEPANVTPPPSIPVAQRAVEVGVTALQACDFTALVDGETQPFHLEEDEAISVEGAEEITLSACEGGVFELVVNGQRVNNVGERHSPYQQTFTPDSYRGERSESPTPAD